jgi:histidine triad (HIT) family protein
MPDCLFCKIITGEIPCQKIYEDEDTLAFLDIRPGNPGHTLVIPKIHTLNLLEISCEDVVKIMNVIKKIAPIIIKTVGAFDFNIIVNVGKEAGQSVFHTHFHILPRFAGDGYELWKGREVSFDELSQLSQILKNHF